MFEATEARLQVNHHAQITSTGKLADRNIRRSTKHGECCICDSTKFNTYHELERDGLHALTGDDDCNATQILTNNTAHPQHRQVCISPSENYILQQETNVQKKKQQLKMDQRIKHMSKRIAMKYLQIIKRISTSFKNVAAKKNYLSNLQKGSNNQSENRAECSIKNGTGHASTLQSPRNNCIRLLGKNRYKEPDQVSMKNPAPNLLLKIKLCFKSYLNGVVIKSEPSNRLKRCNHMCREPVVFNYIFPYRCSSSESIEDISDTKSDKSCAFNASSTIFLTSNTSSESSNDQQFRDDAQIRIGIPIIDIEPCVRNISMYNMHRSDNVLIRYLNTDTKANGIKTLRRATLKRHRKRTITPISKSYRQNFNKKYQTYFAEINYRNQVLELSPPCRQAVRIGSTWDCNIDFGRNPNGDGNTILENSNLPLYQCPPGTCTTDKCNPKKCYKRLKNNVPYGSHATTQSRTRALRKKSYKRHIGQERANGLNHVSLVSQEQHSRPKVRIGSNTTFNIQAYKETPLGARSINRSSNRYRDSVYGKQAKRHKAGRGRRKRKPLKSFECPPDMCVPEKCKPGECYQRLKAVHIGTVIDSSISGSANLSQVGTQSKKINEKHLRTGKETFYKDRAVPSMPTPKLRLNTPRQAVRIGSKFSFNIEFYRSLPHSGLVADENTQEDISDSQTVGVEKKRKSRKRYQCEPGVCVPGQCNANACFQKLKSTHSQASPTGSLKGTSQGSQASSKSEKKMLKSENTTFLKERGSSTMPRPKLQTGMPNRQAVRIGSKCSFNIEFYRSMPQNGYAMNGHGQNDSETKRVPRIQCEPGVCIPGKCNTKECFQILKAKQRTAGVDSSATGSSNVISQGSQASSGTRKKKKALKAEKATFYKEQGSLSMPRSKTSTHLPNRRAVRIGSKCSFNIEFYRSVPGNGFGTNGHDQGDSNMTRKPKYQCEPNVCIPGKCNANECFLTLKNKQISGSSLTGSSNAMSQGSQAVSKIKNKKRDLQPGKSTFYRDKGVSSIPGSNNPMQKPRRQAVRIASKCSFNVEFYKSMPQHGYHPANYSPNGNGYDPANYLRNGNGYQPANLLQNSYRQGVGKGIKPKNIYECEPGVCVRGKCNAMECYQRFKRSPMSNVTDTSYTGSSTGSSRKLHKQQPRIGNETMYKEKGVPTISRYKQILNLPNKQAVRIGSNCSFNIDFYRSMPQRGHVTSEQNYEHMASIQSYMGQNKQMKNYTYPEPYNYGDTSVRYPYQGGMPARYHQQGDMPIPYHYQGGVPNTPAQHILGKRKKIKPRKKFECEHGICIPGKCNPYMCVIHSKSPSQSQNLVCIPKICAPGKCDPRDCYRRMTGIDFSGTDTSFASRGSQALTKKSKSKKPDVNKDNATYYKERGASSMPRAKGPLEIGNRQAVRIGSTCSFNIEFYKNTPYTPGKGMPRFKEPYSQEIQNRQYPEQYYQSSTETVGERSGRVICECFSQIAEAAKKIKIKTKKEVPSELPKTKQVEAAKVHKKPLSGLHDQGDTVTQQKPSETKKTPKKIKPEKPKKPLDKTIDQDQNIDGYETEELTPKKGKKDKPSKEKHKQKQESPILQDQGDAIVQPEYHDTGTEIKPRPEREQQKRIKQAISVGRINDQGDKGFEYELGVCIPNKCDPYLCFERLRNKDGKSKNEGTSTDASLSTSSKHLQVTPSSSSVSKSTGVNLERREEAERRKQAKATLPVHKDQGTSSIIINKNKEDVMQPLPLPQTPSRDKSKYKSKDKNRDNCVRIGSSCSFNIQFFKEKPMTPSEVQAAMQAESVMPKSSEVDKETNGFMAFWKKCCCKLNGKSGQTAANDQGIARQSQTRGLVCVPGICDFDRCYRSDCPARMQFTDAGIGTQLRAKSTLPSYSADAGTQSRRLPLLQKPGNFNSAICKCCGSFSPSRASNGYRKIPLYDMPLGSNMGYGDNFQDCRVREQAVIIGSGCGFNVNFFKKPKK